MTWQSRSDVPGPVCEIATGAKLAAPQTASAKVHARAYRIVTAPEHGFSDFTVAKNGPTCNAWRGKGVSLGAACAPSATLGSEPAATSIV